MTRHVNHVVHTTSDPVVSVVVTTGSVPSELCLVSNAQVAMRLI